MAQGPSTLQIRTTTPSTKKRQKRAAGISRALLTTPWARLLVWESTPLATFMWDVAESESRKRPCRVEVTSGVRFSPLSTDRIWLLMRTGTSISPPLEGFLRKPPPLPDMFRAQSAVWTYRISRSTVLEMCTAASDPRMEVFGKKYVPVTHMWRPSCPAALM